MEGIIDGSVTGDLPKEEPYGRLEDEPRALLDLC